MKKEIEELAQSLERIGMRGFGIAGIDFEKIAKHVLIRELRARYDELNSQLVFCVQKPWTSPELEKAIQERMIEIRSQLDELLQNTKE